MKRTFKIYGLYGHRIKESFNESHMLDVSNYRDYPCIISITNSDITGTNDYCLVEIESDDLDNIYAELEGQLSDGIFENCRTGYVAELKMYQVDFDDYETGASSPIDTIYRYGDYTADDYVAHCKEYADPEWVEMLEHGSVSLIPIDHWDGIVRE